MDTAVAGCSNKAKATFEKAGGREEDFEIAKRNGAKDRAGKIARHPR